MPQGRDDGPSTPEQIGPMRGKTDLRAAPVADDNQRERTQPHDQGPDPSTKGSSYFPTGREAQGVVRAGPCGKCQSIFYWRVVSSDGVRLLQCVSCRALYLDT